MPSKKAIVDWGRTALRKKNAIKFQEPAVDAIDHSAISGIGHEIYWDVYAALDLGLELLRAANFGTEMLDIEKIAKRIDPDYEYTEFDHNSSVYKQAWNVTGAGIEPIAQFTALLLEDVNWHTMSAAVDEYFFGQREERYPEFYEENSPSSQDLQERRKKWSASARTAGRKKKAQEDQSPGKVSNTLRRRMGDPLADIFDEFGPDIYNEAVLALKDVILEKFRSGFDQLETTVKEELGKRGIEESQQHIRPWSNEIVENINHFGLDEVAGALEDYVGSLSAEYSQTDGEDGEEIFELESDEVEEIEEEDVEEPADEDIEDVEFDLEEIPEEEEDTEEEADASFGRGRSRRTVRKRFTR